MIRSLRHRKRNNTAAIIAFACVFSLLFSCLAYGTDETAAEPADPDADVQETEVLESPEQVTVCTGSKEQTITTDRTSYDGIAGETQVINASAKGTITFSSGNKAIAKIGKTSGKITMLKSGYVTITIRAAATDKYAAAAKSIKVAVYPKKLKPVTLKIASSGKARVQFKWNEVPFATKYTLYKYNVATGKYVKLSDFDAASSNTSITRNAGRYAMRAYASVHDTTLKSSSLKPVAVTSPAAKAATYKKSRIIRKYTKSNLLELAEINGASGTTVPQSFCFTGDSYVVSYVNLAGSLGRLISYDRKGNLKETGPLLESKIGHANGTTYNPNTNEIYTVRTHSEIYSKKCTVLSPDTLKVTRSFSLSKYASGIAYDESTNKYYVSKGNQVHVYNSKFKYEKSIHKFIRYNHAQDIGAYNGVVLVCTWVSGTTSYVDLYRTSDGAYLGSYSFLFDEIESVVIDDGYLVILMNHVGDNKDHLYKTKKRITLN